MKKIEAIIRPSKLEEVIEALQEIGINGVTVSEVMGFGKQRGHSEIYRGSEYSYEFVPKILLVTIVPDEEAGAVIGTIAKSAWTGHIGDGKIFISSVEESLHIRTSRCVREAEKTT